MTKKKNNQSLSYPIIEENAEERLYDIIQREMTPSETSGILDALNGDLREWGNLVNSMLVTWPRLQTNIEEVKNKVAKAPLTIEPYSLRGQKPTQSAIERAEFVHDALYNMRGNVNENEVGFSGLIEDLCMAFFTGHNVSEIRWETLPDGSMLPKAAYCLPWRHYRYPEIAGEKDRLMLNRDGFYNTELEDFPEHRFVVAVKKANNSHASIAAPLRALVQYWMASIYGLKWFLNFTQIYGIPMRFANYADEKDLPKVKEMLQKMGSAVWGAFPNGVDVKVIGSNNLSGGIPQQVLLQIADNMADIFVLGQTLTTDTNGKGSYALGSVHADVRLDKMQAVADFVEKILNQQLVDSILKLNYGNCDERPKINIEFDKPVDELAMAQRDKILFTEMGIQTTNDYLYKRHKIEKPEGNNELQLNQKPLEKVEAKHIEAKSQESRIDKIVNETMGSIPNVKREWLEPVKNDFFQIVQAALSQGISDEEFIQYVEATLNKMPELADKLNTNVLEASLRSAIVKSMFTGATINYNER